MRLLRAALWLSGQDEERRYLCAINQRKGSAQAAELLGILEKQLVKPTADAHLTRLELLWGLRGGGRGGGSVYMKTPKCWMRGKQQQGGAEEAGVIPAGRGEIGAERRGMRRCIESPGS